MYTQILCYIYVTKQKAKNTAGIMRRNKQPPRGARIPHMIEFSSFFILLFFLVTYSYSSSFFCKDIELFRKFQVNGEVFVRLSTRKVYEEERLFPNDKVTGKVIETYHSYYETGSLYRTRILG